MGSRRLPPPGRTQGARVPGALSLGRVGAQAVGSGEVWLARAGALVAATVGESGGSALVIMEGRGRLGSTERPSEGDGPRPSREGSPAMGGTNQV